MRTLILVFIGLFLFPYNCFLGFLSPCLSCALSGLDHCKQCPLRPASPLQSFFLLSPFPSSCSFISFAAHQCLQSTVICMACILFGVPVVHCAPAVVVVVVCSVLLVLVPLVHRACPGLHSSPLLVSGVLVVSAPPCPGLRCRPLLVIVLVLFVYRPPPGPVGPGLRCRPPARRHRRPLSCTVPFRCQPCDLFCPVALVLQLCPPSIVSIVLSLFTVLSIHVHLRRHVLLSPSLSSTQLIAIIAAPVVVFPDSAFLYVHFLYVHPLLLKVTTPPTTLFFF
jgi:hypothetical protein